MTIHPLERGENESLELTKKTLRYVPIAMLAAFAIVYGVNYGFDKLSAPAESETQSPQKRNLDKECPDKNLNQKPFAPYTGKVMRSDLTLKNQGKSFAVANYFRNQRANI